MQSKFIMQICLERPYTRNIIYGGRCVFVQNARATHLLFRPLNLAQIVAYKINDIIAHRIYGWCWRTTLGNLTHVDV